MTTETEFTPAELEKRPQPARTHGARSEAQIRPRARTAKQRLLRQVGLSASQLDGVARGYLDNWARAQAKAELMDNVFRLDHDSSRHDDRAIALALAAHQLVERGSRRSAGGGLPGIDHTRLGRRLREQRRSAESKRPKALEKFLNMGELPPAPKTDEELAAAEVAARRKFPGYADPRWG